MYLELIIEPYTKNKTYMCANVPNRHNWATKLSRILGIFLEDNKIRV